MVYRVLPTMVALLLGACGDPGQWRDDGEPAATAVTDVTSITEVTSVDGTGGGEPSADGEVRRSGGEDAPAAQPLDLSIDFLSGNSAEAPRAESDYLFAEKSDGVNFFQSGEEERPSVKVKGKLYMIDEPVPERRLDNVDGGEIGIEVPLR